MATPLLHIDQLTVRFGAAEVVRQVSLDIHPGEKLALVGESGSGKTVMAQAVLRLNREVTHQGRIELDGVGDVLSLSERALRGVRGRDAAMIFQEPMTALNPLYSVGNQICETLTLHLGLPQSATQDQIRELVQAWLQRQARRVFEERCAHFAPKLGVRVRRLSLSSAATRWGSASADGSVRLNWRLIHFALPVIDYVVTHELAHLREMNHSPAFWEVVRSVLPDFERSRGALRSEVLPSLD